MAAKVNEGGEVVIPTRVLWLIISVLLGLVGTGAFGITNGNAKGDRIETQINKLQPKVAVNTAAVAAQTQALAEFKTEMKEAMKDLKKDLREGQRDTNQKLDRLLEIQLRNNRRARGGSGQ